MIPAKIDPHQAPPEIGDYAGSARLAVPIIAGLAVIGVFFGGFGTWATLAPLESAAIAPGVIIVDSSRKTVQHLEGGIIAEISVNDGDLVEEGQPLIVLDDTQADASLGLIQGRHKAFVAHEARLIAERDGADAVSFPPDLLQQTDDPKIAEAIAGQRRIFAERRATLAGQTDILRQTIAQTEEEIAGLKKQISAEREQARLIALELADMQTLLDKKLVPKARVLALQRAQADIKGSIAIGQASVARAKQAIGESELRIRELQTSLRNDAVAELRQVQTEIFGLEERLRAASDVAKRTVITSPQKGIIVGLRFHTAGGVVKPGEPMMDIVPVDDNLVVEASVGPNDIDVVHAGLPAKVHLTAFSARSFIPVDGIVTQVSADSLYNEAEGTSFFKARITLDEASVKEALGNKELYPGMQAEVMIVTGERTTIDYLLDPILHSFNRAFRED